MRKGSPSSRIPPVDWDASLQAFLHRLKPPASSAQVSGERQRCESADRRTEVISLVEQIMANRADTQPGLSSKQVRLLKRLGSKGKG